MISTCPGFRLVCTSSLLIPSRPLCPAENSRGSVTSDFPVANFRVHLFILILLILAASFIKDGHSFLKHSLFSAFKTLLSQFFFFLHCLLCWHLLIFPISGMPKDCLHTSICFIYFIYLRLLPRKSHLSEDIKFSYMLINPKWTPSPPTSPLNFRIISSC